MDIYLVGGAVRDELLGLAVRERDWVVVGSTPNELEAQGFRQVGKDFPVFLHPRSHEEYALARTERKTAPGYHGFETRFSPDVTLDEDLQRRDLTINAMAKRPDGTIIDPYGGMRDLAARILRHVSPAFAEDPVRILRLARFAARYAHLGFTVAPETMALMQQMVIDGEATALVAERVWAETEKALAEPSPVTYFAVLRESGALGVIFPELDRLYGVPQPERWHPEIDTGLHVMLVLGSAAALSKEPRVRFAALMHDLGKGTTPKSEWPKHHGHEARGAKIVDALCARLRIPNDFRDLAIIVAREHGNVHRAMEMRADTILALIERCDGVRRPERFREAMVACMADARGRTGFEQVSYPQADFLNQALDAVRQVTVDANERAGLDGASIGRLFATRRLQVLKQLCRDRPIKTP
jgi:tRNA nucleotidyltransferase (CCA-adding enzyme)